MSESEANTIVARSHAALAVMGHKLESARQQRDQLIDALKRLSKQSEWFRPAGSCPTAAEEHAIKLIEQMERT